MSENQRVSIQYSIGIEELPQEVARLLHKTQTQLKEIVEKDLTALMDSPRESVLSLNTLTDVAVARKKVALIDHILNDVENIINGFVSYRVQETLPEDTDVEQRAPTPADTIADQPPFDPASQMSAPTHHPGMPTGMPPGMPAGTSGMPDSSHMTQALSHLSNMDMDDFRQKIQLMKEARDARSSELPDAPVEK